MGKKSGGPLTPKRPAFAFLVTPKPPARRGEVEKSDGLRIIQFALGVKDAYQYFKR